MIFVTGDMHGDLKKLKGAGSGLRKGDWLLIAGDFGFLWKGDEAEKKRLAKIGKAKYHICFVDGSNENHELLAQLPVSDFCGGKAACVSGNLWHLLRGEIYTIEDRTVFAFGGAKSADIEAKQAYGNWYAGELPTDAELENGVKNLEAHGWAVDFLLTHEPSASLLASMEAGFVDCDNLQIYFDEIGKRTKYTMWLFGSMHRDRRLTYKVTAVFRDVIPLNPQPGKGKKKK